MSLLLEMTWIAETSIVGSSCIRRSSYGTKSSKKDE
jgi:hypothetical protein